MRLGTKSIAKSFSIKVHWGVSEFLQRRVAFVRLVAFLYVLVLLFGDGGARVLVWGFVASRFTRRSGGKKTEEADIFVFNNQSRML